MIAGGTLTAFTKPTLVRTEYEMSQIGRLEPKKTNGWEETLERMLPLSNLIKTFLAASILIYIDRCTLVCSSR